MKNALWMAPDDQSGWLYHRWLIGAGDDIVVLEREIAMIEELLEVEPESRCKYFVLAPITAHFSS